MISVVGFFSGRISFLFHTRIINQKFHVTKHNRSFDEFMLHDCSLHLKPHSILRLKTKKKTKNYKDETFDKKDNF